MRKARGTSHGIVHPDGVRCALAPGDVVLLSSGAVGVGCQKIDLRERPAKMSQKQAVAAVGQPHPNEVLTRLVFRGRQGRATEGPAGCGAVAADC